MVGKTGIKKRLDALHKFTSALKEEQGPVSSRPQAQLETLIKRSFNYVETAFAETGLDIDSDDDWKMLTFILASVVYSLHI